jgi:DNA replication and repair protein RecF
MDFSQGTNILYGENAQGKTNILESLYMISTTKSHRGVRDRDMIRFGVEESHIRSLIMKGGIDYRVDMHLRKNKSKGIAIDGQRIKKAADLLGLCNVVLFSPEDLSIIKEGPSERRNFVDMELCQLDNFYLYNLNNYNKIVNQRNSLLKDLYFQPELKETLNTTPQEHKMVNYKTASISSHKSQS